MKAVDISKAAGKSVPGGFFVRLLLLITAVAWILRLVAAWEMSRAGGGMNNMFTPPETSDLATYMQLGQECAAGNFPRTFYYQPYYYAVFLAAINWLCGAKMAVYAVILVQSLLSAATVFLTGWCGRKIFSSAAGLVAAGLTAISATLILYVPYHQNETLQTFHLILLLYLTLKAYDADKWQWWLAAGTVTGIAILTRGNIWMLVPAIAFFTLKRGKFRKKSWLHLALFLFCMIVVQLPFMIRNSVAEERLCGASTAADAVLAIGNGIDAPAGGREPWERAGAMYYSESYKRMMANASGRNAVSVPEQMWQWFCDDPAGFIELQCRKALLFWDGREIPNNVSLEYDGCRNSFVLQYLAWGHNRVLLALGLAGIFWFLPGIKKECKRGRWILLYTFVGIFYLTVVMFYILSRFRAPLLPLLAIFGGGAVCSMINAWRYPAPGKVRLTRMTIVLTLLLGILPVNGGYEWYRDMEPALQRTIHPDGIIMDLQGKNILHFDYGPQPFGGWQNIPVKKGMVIGKQFARIGTVPAELRIMMCNYEPVSLVMRINGELREFELPPPAPGKNEYKMVMMPMENIYNGKVQIEILDISGGELWVVCDHQRDYRRSFLNGRVLPGEWVIAAGVPRGI
ncbi:MAG: glycosyltransferase family 39 protein [Lentisphaerae bacterium]|nr:glycosyltransferase family 39 protein [Lentisphaerota bacterium]